MPGLYPESNGWAERSARRWVPRNGDHGQPIVLSGTPAQIRRYIMSFLITQLSTALISVIIFVILFIYLGRRNQPRSTDLRALELSVPLAGVTLIWNLANHGSSFRHQLSRPGPSIRAFMECTLAVGAAVCFGILCYVIKSHVQEHFAFSGGEIGLAVLIGATMLIRTALVCEAFVDLQSTSESQEASETANI